MTITTKAYDNGDHACIVWLPTDHALIPNCRGFTIRRIVNDQVSYLHGFVGFSDSDTLDETAPWKFPLQRYLWWDYSVHLGDVVQYSVIPVIGPDKDHLTLDEGNASDLTDQMTITGQTSPHLSAYFNKGVVAAQWVSRALAGVPAGAKLGSLITEPENALRNALSGLLRPQLLSLLANTQQDGGEIYAAMYELNDPELIPALTALGPRCHLLLANGAFKPPTNDENADVRAKLRNEVDLHDRMVTGSHFAHNKFVVFCDPGGNPQCVLTGSTNWTSTGLCTQANNAVLIGDPDIAADFLAEWKLLVDAGNGYPKSLATANSTSQTFTVDGASITQWFAPTTAGQDLDYARTLINAAQDGVLFLFFNPGVFKPDDQPEMWTLLQNILFRHHVDNPNYDPALYIRGVVNQNIVNLTSSPAQNTDSSGDSSAPAPVALYSGGDKAPLLLNQDAMIPANIKATFHEWATEILGSGVHVHSKVVVIDPFGDKPVVMTGSHNLGYKAATQNDDNLVIIEGSRPLAVAYALNIIAILESYRWNSYVEAHRQDPKAWHGLVDSDSWQSTYLIGAGLAEIKFWLGGAPAA
jgi:phosphatidylserine/phosphatidylglycerophosphate/cardiolipin synthase-like enzyme